MTRPTFSFKKRIERALLTFSEAFFRVKFVTELLNLYVVVVRLYALGAVETLSTACFFVCLGSYAGLYGPSL